MQICDVTVRHAGRLDMTVRKSGVTVAEIAVLRLIHGDDAVIEISPRKNDRRPHEYELDRLRFLYRPARADEAHPVDILWPGVNKTLPVNLEDIGIKRGSPFLGQPPRAVPEDEGAAHNFFDPPDFEGDDEEAAQEPKTAEPPASPADSKAAQGGQPKAA